MLKPIYQFQIILRSWDELAQDVSLDILYPCIILGNETEPKEFVN
jgi:hypothetical protein